MRNTFLAIDAATDLRAHARDLRRSWEAAFSGSLVPGGVRPVIAHSWSRMTGAGLDPAHLRPQVALDDRALADARAQSPLRAAVAALRSHLGAIAQEAEHVMVVCDADGRILWLEGHPRVLDGARGIDFQPGMFWTEDSAGTNAIGTALAIDHPVQIFSAEHFLPDQHAWWCSAAPLHDPVTGGLLGVVDVSGPQRTAHPYSLMLVTAAARIAGDVLREQQIERDNRLRDAYVERIRRSPGSPSAVIDERGRLLQAAPTGWVQDPVPPPGAPGRVTLPTGVAAEAERLDEGWVLWRADRRPSRPSAAGVRGLSLRLLGRHGHEVRVAGGAPQALSLRQAEALALLVLHPEGLTAEQLTLLLYGEDGKTVTTRALMSRLRELVGPYVDARPYRLSAEVDADVVAVATLLQTGEVTRAQQRYRGPLLAASEVERVVAWRTEVAAAVRNAALQGSADSVWWWIDSEGGREDADAMRVFLRIADGHDVRREVVASRLEAALATSEPSRP